MKIWIGVFIGAFIMFTCSSFNLLKPFGWQSEKQQNTITMESNHENMKLGAFSASLSVKDLNASKEFYEHLGFNEFAGAMDKNYLIMKNGSTLIGLFQGMFENNIMTFNPGWDNNAQNVDPFADVRLLQKHFKEKGIHIANEVDESSTGPANFVIMDPDGNAILIDQHR